MPLLRNNGKELLLIHIPKCGGTSLEQVFSPDIQLTMLHNGAGELPCSPQHFQASLLEKLFDYKIPPAIAVVRNPFDRIVSEYRYQVQNGLDANLSFDQFTNNSLGEFWKNRYVYDNHIRPQVEFICAETTIFRFEEDGVSAARSHIADFFGLSCERTLAKKNVSKKIDFSLAPETIRLINEFYERDFLLLGYPKVSEGKKARKHSSLRYSSKATAEISASSVIRQKVVNDIVAITEEEGDRKAADLEAALSSGIEENLRQQSAENAEVKILLGSIQADVETTGKHIADEFNRLCAAIENRGLTIEGVREILGRVVTIVGEGFQGQDEAQTALVEQMTASISGVADKLLSLDKNLGELGQSVSDGLKVERDLIADSIARDQKSRASTGKQNLAEAVGRIVSELGAAIELQRTQFSESVDVLRENFNLGMHDNIAPMEQKFSGIERVLDETTGKVIGELHASMASQKNQLSESVDVLRASFEFGLSEKIGPLEQTLSGIERGLDETTGKVLGELHASIDSQKNQLSESVDVLREGFNLGMHDNIAPMEQKFSGIERVLDETTGKVIGELHASMASQKNQLSESVDVLRASFEFGLSEKIGPLEQTLSGIERGLDETTGKVLGEMHASMASQKAQLSVSLDVLRASIDVGLSEKFGPLEQKLSGVERGLEETAGKAFIALQESIASQKAQLSESVDVLRESFSADLSNKTSDFGETLSGIAQELVQFKEAQEQSRRKGEYEVVEQFKNLVEILQLEIRELDDRFEESNTRLMEAKSNERYLNRRLEDVLAVEAENVGQLATLTVRASSLEHEKIRLEEEGRSLRRTIDEMQKSQGVIVSKLEQEKETAIQESESRAHTIAEMEQCEQSLRNELLETSNRFNVEIAYRESLVERVRILELDLKHVRGHNKELLESTSFRLTKPLRILSVALRPWRHGRMASSSPLRLEDLRKEVSISPAKIEVDYEIQTKSSQLSVAIVVENLDRGGLEQVVLDHARYFSSHCKSLDLFVINETGQVYEQALQYGIDIFCVMGGKVKLEKFLEQKRFDLAFFHHSYGYLPAFRPYTNELVEVIHNEYSWQQGIEFFETIRAETVDKFIAVSDPVREYAISNLAINPERIVTIVNGLNVEGLIRPPIEVLRERRNDTIDISPTFVMCANGQAQKNHVLVIRAFSRLLKKYPQAKLQLAGNLAVDKDVGKEIEAELDKCGSPSNIELVGSLNRRELSRLLANAHIALLPTKYEGFSIATLEYLYFGLPMILSNTGGASYISNNYGSIIVDDKIRRSAGVPAAAEVKSLAGNLAKMLREYPAYCEKSDLAARSYANYTVDAVCSNYLELDG